MASPSPGRNPPPKPWERTGNSGGPTPFKPPSSGSTSDVVEASGVANPGEIVPKTSTNASQIIGTPARPVPPVPGRPWQQNYGNSYGSVYNSSYGSGYNSYGGYGGVNGGVIGGGIGGGIGGSLYGRSMYNAGGYGGYNGGLGLYGGNMYNSGYGTPMGGYGFGGGNPYDNQDPNNPSGPPQPPGFWVSLLRVMQGVVNFFGRFSVLVDQNTQALHLFMSALLQLFDRSGMLYGELLRFVLRILGWRTKSRMKNHRQIAGPDAKGENLLEGPKDAGQNLYEGSRDAAGGSWDGFWGTSS